MRKGNKHRGSDFDDFLRDEAIFDEVQAAALKRALAEAVEEAMKESNLSPNGAIPPLYTREGKDLSPPLAFGGVPAGTSDARSLREPNLCAYAQVNSAPSKKIWAE